MRPSVCAQVRGLRVCLPHRRLRTELPPGCIQGPWRPLCGAVGKECVMEDYIKGLPMPPGSADAAVHARAMWNAVAKPIGSLGLLEDAVVRIAALTGSAEIDLSRRCVAVLCADNGVVAQGVSQSGCKVTSVVASNIAQGVSSVCSMAAPFDIDCLAVDMGMCHCPADENIIRRPIAAGTQDISRGPAMTRTQALQAVRTGVELVGELAQAGYCLIAVGEMGVGNTTTATAVTCALTGVAPRVLVGRGAGLSNEGLVRKRAAIERALAVNAPDPHDTVDVLAKVGGFDLAGMCGMFLGGAVHRVPVLVDGLVSSVAALCATLLRPDCAHALLPSHLSSEPAAQLVMERLGLTPPVQAGMHLGEGTGAVCMIALLDAALALYRGTTFNACGLEPYEVRLT